MTNAELIAGLAGPVLIALSAAILINRQTMVGVIKDVTNGRGFIFFAGILSMVAGLAIVRVHNVWSGEWNVLVTVIGWLALIGGIARIVWPDRIADVSNQLMASENAITGWALVTLMLGAFLTAKGYALI